MKPFHSAATVLQINYEIFSLTFPVIRLKSLITEFSLVHKPFAQPTAVSIRIFRRKASKKPDASISLSFK